VEDTVKIFATKHAEVPGKSRYATAADFCRIFEKVMDRLYLLSLLLTGNAELAEECFVGGLETSKDSNPVFKDWARSWARRTIVRNAIRIIQPRTTDILPSPRVADHDRTQSAVMAAILALPAFDRFAYVLSVLEGYPLQECALLLDCRRDEVVTARMRALQTVVQSVEHREATRDIDSGNQGPRGSDQISQLAVTA
jgi:DNA-directed RNA polymerase specialized sigma24 family protein